MLAICLVLIFTMALSAVADSGTLLDRLIAKIKEMEVMEKKAVSISNDLIEADEVIEKWEESSWIEGCKPSAADILATGDEIYIKMPHESYYLDE